jgi:hypothetical protein
MDPFSYLVVLTSIILGLGVTRLVGGLGHLMQTRRRKRPYWVHTLWMLNLLMAMAVVWWMAYRWRSNEHWTFLLFIWLLLLPTILYLISSLLFPDQDDQPITDWEAYFYQNQRDIFLFYALIFPIDIIDTFLKGLAALPRPRPALRDDDGALVRFVSYRRVYETQTLPRVFCRDLSGLQSGIRWHYVANRSRRHRRNTTIESRFVHNPTGCLVSNPRGGR